MFSLDIYCFVLMVFVLIYLCLVFDMVFCVVLDDILMSCGDRFMVRPDCI